MEAELAVEVLHQRGARPRLEADAPAASPGEILQGARGEPLPDALPLPLRRNRQRAEPAHLAPGEAEHRAGRRPEAEKLVGEFIDQALAVPSMKPQPHEDRT